MHSVLAMAKSQTRAGAKTVTKLKTLLRKPEFNRVREHLLGLAQPAIGITTVRRPMSRIKLGASRFGGVPDSPVGSKWPRWRGQPMNFLAMLKLSEIQRVAGDERLPRTGFLYFWYAGAAFTWGFDPKDRGSFRVEYVPDEAVKLKRAAVPKGHTRGSGDLRTKPYLPCVLKIASKVTLPSQYEEKDWSPKLPARAEKAYEALLGKLAGTELGQGRHALLGYPSVLQGPMRYECQYVSNGVHLGGAKPPSKRVAAKLDPGVRDWVLLAQFDTDEEGPDWMWGDVGSLYFWIRRQDLEQCRFDRIWGVLQCY